MRCPVCGPAWSDELRRCPICGRALTAGAVAGLPTDSALGEGIAVAAVPDLSAFDPWAQHPDGPSIPLAELPEPAVVREEPPGARYREQLVFAWINRARGERSIATLHWDEAAALVAGRLSAGRAEGDLAPLPLESEDLRSRVEEAGTAAAACTENVMLAAGIGEAHRLLMDGEPGSAPALDRLLDPSMTRAGLGVADTPDGQIVLTEILFRPR